MPAPGTDVYFNGVGGSTNLGTDFSVRTVNFTSGATVPVTIGGVNTLTIGSGRITVQAGTAAHTISSAVKLGGVQSWSSLASNRFTVSGNISGPGPLTFGGTGVISLSGNNSYGGGTLISGGILAVTNSSGSATGSGIVSILAGGTLAGTGNISGAINVTGVITSGNADGTFGTLTTGYETWQSAATFAAAFSVDGSLHDQLSMTGLLVSSTSISKFNIIASSAGSPVFSPNISYVLATDSEGPATNPFYPSTFLSVTQQELNLQISGLQPANGYAFQWATQQDGMGYDLVLNQVSTAVPEPAILLVLGAMAPLALGRRRRQRQAAGRVA